ncbi:MAG: haloacid dehalogenase type II [Bacteroidetes bacterium]|nr:haloacid dehalogenase type II [Bacteroidota bacterium]MDA1121350.1 haloacid dehalogenase type II [Bacteroidota bacterium]
MTFAFDIYGTLIDPMALGQVLEGMIGDKAPPFNNLWRDKQLEYSFRKAVMNQFNHFSECTSQALEYCNTFFKTRLSESQKGELLDMYRKLPAYSETLPCMQSLREKGHEIIAFSNGKKDDLISLFENAKILRHFDQIISVDEVRTFKPSPKVYELLIRKSSSSIADTWLVSANSFDIIGAAALGLKTIWLKRNTNTVFDPFGLPYTRTCDNLLDITGAVE